MIKNSGSIMRKVNFPAGSTIFSQGDTSKEIYILNRGIIEVLTGNNVVAQISQRGVFFGEMATILKEERNATLRAQTDCNCIVLYDKYMEVIIKSTPEIGFSLVRVLAQRLKQTTKKLAELLEESSQTSPSFKNPYQLMLALKMISVKDFNQAVTTMRKDTTPKHFVYYLKKTAKVDEADMLKLIELFKKYHIH